MLTSRRILACMAFLVPAAGLSGFAVIMARKIVKRGPKDYRRAEVTEDGRRIRIDLDDYTKAPGDFGVFDPATEKYTGVGEVTLINEDQKYESGGLIRPAPRRDVWGQSSIGPRMCSSSPLLSADATKRWTSPPPTVRRLHGCSRETRTYG